MFALLVMGGVGVIFALILIVADKLFRVEEDPRLKKVLEVLPGLNCGACGYPSCERAGESLVKGEVDCGVCVVGGTRVAEELNKILGGGEVGVRERKVAVLHCGADEGKRKKLAEYEGITTCVSASIVGGGLACNYGCLGFGDCEKVCPVSAIKMVHGLPWIDHEKCIGCGKCVKECPRNLFELVPYRKGLYWVACKNEEPGKKVREVCEVGCIACRLCEKLSGGVFQVENNLARINRSRQEEEVDWEKVAGRCPTGCILSSTTCALSEKPVR